MKIQYLKMMNSIFRVVGEMERNQIKEMQKEGIRIVKMKGAYNRRKKVVVKML